MLSTASEWGPARRPSCERRISTGRDLVSPCLAPRGIRVEWVRSLKSRVPRPQHKQHARHDKQDLTHRDLKLLGVLRCTVDGIVSDGVEGPISCTSRAWTSHDALHDDRPPHIAPHRSVFTSSEQRALPTHTTHHHVPRQISAPTRGGGSLFFVEWRVLVSQKKVTTIHHFSTEGAERL